jgi:PAS domain S-box-containing protein
MSTAKSSLSDNLGMLWHRLTEPRTTDRDEARREHATKVILGIVTLSMIALSPLFALARLIAPSEVTLDMPIVAAAFSLIFGGSWWLAYRGHWQLSSYIPPLITLSLAISNTYTYGLGATNLAEYTVAILLTTLLQSDKASWGVLVLSLVTGLGIQGQKILQSPEKGFADWVYWAVVLGAFYTIVILLLRFLVGQFRRALAHSNALAAELREKVTQHRQAENALRKSEERLRQVVENMPVMMDALDRDNNIIVWNRECERVTGYSAEEIVGNSRAMELLYPDEDYREQIIAQAERHNANFRDLEQEITCKDGSTRAISWSNISEQFPIPGWFTWAIGVDITERVRAERKLREHREHLEELIDERTAELRQMLNLMAGREVRMAELKDVIKKLRAQLKSAGLEPVADDPLLRDDNTH